MDEGVVYRWARKMEDKGIAPNTYVQYIQLIQSVWVESRASTLYSSKVDRHDFLPIPTVWISCMYVFGATEALVFHFVSSSIYNSFIYDNE